MCFRRCKRFDDGGKGVLWESKFFLDQIHFDLIGALERPILAMGHIARVATPSYEVSLLVEYVSGSI